jgi:hypothetical protein
MARGRTGWTEAMMLVQGFTADSLVGLIRAGLAAASIERMIAGWKPVEVTRVRIDADTAERRLGHAIGGVRGVYDRHPFREEKRLAFEKLAALIEGIVKSQANVVPLRAR